MLQPQTNLQTDYFLSPMKRIPKVVVVVVVDSSIIGTSLWGGHCSHPSFILYTCKMFAIDGPVICLGNFF